MNKTYMNPSYPNSESLQAFVYNDPQVAQQCALLPLNALRLFTVISQFDMVCKKIFPSRATLAHNCGDISVRTITRMAALLEQEGLLRKTRDLSKPFDTCEYELTPAGRFNKKRIKHYLKMWGVVVFSLSFLVSPQKPVSEPTVPPYNYSDLYLFKAAERSDHSKPCLQQTATNKEIANEANTAGRSQLLNARVREERSMEHKWVTAELEQATRLLKLTRWGQIRLSAYAAKALATANKRYSESKTTKSDILRWYLAVCNGWCKDNNTSPDWTGMAQRATEHAQPDNAEMLNPATDNDQPFVVEKKAPQQASYRQDLIALERAKMQQKQKDWEDAQDPEALASKKAQFLPYIGHMMLLNGADPVKVAALQKKVTQSSPALEYEPITDNDSNWEELPF